MSMTKSVRNGYNRNIDKWMALGIMKRVEEVQHTVEMLEASIEDLFDQMEIFNSSLDFLADTTDTVQGKIEEMVDILNGEMPVPPSHPLQDNNDYLLPF